MEMRGKRPGKMDLEKVPGDRVKRAGGQAGRLAGGQAV